MSHAVIVHKGRRNTLTVSLGIDVSTNTITSQVRQLPDQNSALIMTWVVTFATDGTDGELILTVDDSVTAGIKENSGYMDLKRLVGGDAIPVFSRPLEVEFVGSVTV